MITNEFTFPTTVTKHIIHDRLILLIKKYCRARTRNLAHPAQVIHASKTLVGNNRTQAGIHGLREVERPAMTDLSAFTAKITFGKFDIHLCFAVIECNNAYRTSVPTGATPIAGLQKKRFGNSLRWPGHLPV